MDLLLDTHVFLWWVQSPEIISTKAHMAIENSANKVFISSISILEIAVKQSIGKLAPDISFDRHVAISGFLQFPLTAEHAYLVKNLPLYHRDPFDRALVAQTKFSGLTLVTCDKILAKYDIPILEA